MSIWMGHLPALPTSSPGCRRVQCSDRSCSSPTSMTCLNIPSQRYGCLHMMLCFIGSPANQTQSSYKGTCQHSSTGNTCGRWNFIHKSVRWYMYPTSDSQGRLDTHSTDTSWRKLTVPNTWAWPSTTSSVGTSISPTSGQRPIKPWDSLNGIPMDVSPRLSPWLTRQWSGQHWSMSAKCETPTIRSTLPLEGIQWRATRFVTNSYRDRTPGWWVISRKLRVSSGRLKINLRSSKWPAPRFLVAYFIKHIERNIVVFTLILFVSTYVLNIRWSRYIADACEGKKVHICYVVNINEDFFCHFLYEIRTLAVQTCDFSWIYELSIYEFGL